MKKKELNNFWCKTTKDNHDKLIKLGFEKIYDYQPIDFFLKVKWGCLVIFNQTNIVAVTKEYIEEHPEYKEIHLVDGEFEFVKEEDEQQQQNDSKDTQTTKQIECQFTMYGLEVPEFECEIWHRDRTYLLGKVRLGSDIKLFRWDWKTGICREDEDFNLTPIKKPWYEDESNIGKAVIDLETTEMLKIIGLSEGSKQIRIGYNESINYHLKVSKARLATKEEVLSLFKG